MAEREILTLKRKSSDKPVSGQIISRKRKLIIPNTEKTEQEDKGQIVTLPEEPPTKTDKPKRTPKPEKIIPIEQALKLLNEYWPELFQSTEAKPMKIKIREDLFSDREKRQLPVSRKQIRRSLKSVALSPVYLKGIVDGAHRYDINGHIAGEVTADEEARSKQLLC